MKNKKTMISIALIVCITLITGIIVYSTLPSTKMRKQLDLGNKYLAALDYEQAVAAFTKAIEIMPDNPDAVSSLINAYLKWADNLAQGGDLRQAISILREGYEITSSVEIQKKIEEYENNISKTDIIEYSEGDALEDFASLVDDMFEVIEYRQLGGFDAFLSFDERKRDYMPLIKETEEYIEYLNLHPVDELCTHDISGESEDYPIPNLPIYYQNTEYPRLGDAYAILAHYYMRIGDMEKSYEIRETLAEYIGDSSILDDHHSAPNSDGMYFDRYGRLVENYVEWEEGKGETYYNEYQDRGNGITRQWSTNGHEVIHEYSSDGRLLSYRDNSTSEWDGWDVVYRDGRAFLEGIDNGGNPFSYEYIITKYGYGQEKEYLASHAPEYID